MISISTQLGHPYNAELLHRNLSRRPMAERDAWWSIFLYHQSLEEQSSINRILDWAEFEETRQSITDQSLLLMGTTLAWFLTTSNRFLRDRTTKALVGLFTGRLSVFCQLLQRFQGVNDLYVLERLLAVAYGCSMRSARKEDVAKVAAWCYEEIFKSSPPPHILIRDYARGVIDRALDLGVELVVDRRKIEPPYDARWPGSIPSEAKLKHLGDWNADNPKVHPSQLLLYSSVMGFGDFARYIIGTNSGSFEWQNLRLGKPRPPSHQEIRERFVSSLSGTQRRLWRRAERAQQQYMIGQFQIRAPDLGAGTEETRNKALQSAKDVAVARFTGSLNRNQLRIYRKHIVAERVPPGYEHPFDLKLIQRFILNRVFELGWTPERFGEFDRSVNHRNFREAHKAERIGKKYQWLAYHEALARVADNFVFFERWSAKPKQYRGTWQVSGLRDIDPSVTLRSTARSRRGSKPASWWAPDYTSWRKIPGDLAWLKSREDLPTIQRVVQLSDPVDGSHWVTLGGFYEWEEPTPIDRERFEIPHRMIWCQLRSYIVRKQDFGEVFEWAKKQNFMGRWMPESHETHYLFLGEFFWSPNYRDACDWCSGQRAWTRGDRGGGQRLPQPVVVTSQEYLWEGSGYDCSIDEGIGIQAPSPWLAQALKLRWNGEEGKFCNSRGRVITRDPSVSAPGPPALLIRESTLRKVLERGGYDILWTILGEKQIIVPNGPYQARNEISGAMAVQGGCLTGRITSRFHKFD